MTPPPVSDKKLCEGNCMTEAIRELNLSSRPGVGEWGRFGGGKM